jgi:hypothetical protein
VTSKPVFLKVTGLVMTGVALSALLSCNRAPRYRTFAAPEEAVRALIEAAKAGSVDQVVAIFGPGGQELIDSSEPAIARRNRDVFNAAVAERWQLVDKGTAAKELVVGNESWPFPVPLARDTNGWRFDTAAGKEEVLARRIGRNELAAIRISKTYVAAQQIYAERGHDGKPAGVYAQTFRSDSGRENGLYWATVAGHKRSPLGDLVAQAAAEGRTASPDPAQPMPFHGYYFKILTAQGAAADGGAKNYVVDGGMSGGFALVAWPAQYDVTGVMTFIVNQSGVVRERDLGLETDQAAKAMTLFNPEGAWRPVQ